MTPDSAAVAAIGLDVVRELRELAEKATPGPWEIMDVSDRTTRDIKLYGVSGPSEIVHGGDGIAVADRMNDRTFSEDNANMEYIAAASPDVLLAFIERIGALERENARLREALEETEEVLALSENTPFPDPAYHDEVKRLGRRIGFGALMSTAERAWREVAEERGNPAGGEFVSGPCRVTLDNLLSQVRAALARTAIQEPTKVEDGGDAESRKETP